VTLGAFDGVDEEFVAIVGGLGWVGLVLAIGLGDKAGVGWLAGGIDWLAEGMGWVAGTGPADVTVILIALGYPPC
jgi:hypothetical protein